MTRTRARPRTALVVSADDEIRRDWARYFQSLGMRATRCSGPQSAACPLLDGTTCPFHAAADIAIYDRATLTPELTLRIIRAGRSLPIAFAMDRIDPQGHHEPAITAIADDGIDTCVGTSVSLAR
jgi:hypothetical protein